jgi:hypothetical protein
MSLLWLMPSAGLQHYVDASNHLVAVNKLCGRGLQPCTCPTRVLLRRLNCFEQRLSRLTSLSSRRWPSRSLFRYHGLCFRLQKVFPEMVGRVSHTLTVGNHLRQNIASTHTSLP